jgi:DNA-binding transcriptional MerR regulator
VLTIGPLAKYAGVTVKAVRHYHRLGLLEEPARDSSGYRRYGVGDAITLVKIKALADAGVPLARVKALLAAGTERFEREIAAVDRRLEERIEALLRTRERLSRLSGGDRLFVSAEVAAYLDRFRAPGVSERTVGMERDMWALMQSVSPTEAAVWIDDKRASLDDSEFRTIYLEYDAAFHWAADDPRLHAPAKRMMRWLASRASASEGGARAVTDPTIVDRLTASFGVTSPAWDRLRAMGAERRAGGRTQLRPPRAKWAARD